MVLLCKAPEWRREATMQLSRGIILVAASPSYFLFSLLAGSLVVDPLLEAFLLALARLPPRPEEAWLCAWRRFPCRFERMLVVAEDDETDRARRRLSRRLFFFSWLLADCVAKLSRLRCSCVRPPWRLRDELRDRPRLTFLLALRRFGASLAASLALLRGGAHRALLAARSRGFGRSLAGRRVFGGGLRGTFFLPRFASRRGGRNRLRR
ncbi:hypothetical protein MRX96_006834 [Rhipicephalus microplus]